MFFKSLVELRAKDFLAELLLVVFQPVLLQVNFGGVISDGHDDSILILKEDFLLTESNNAG